MQTIIVDTKIYSLRAIFSTAYVFLDNYYIFLEDFDDDKIQIKIKSKKEGEDLEKIVDEFKNELINASLRLKISEENKKIRETIVTSALFGRVEAFKIDDPKGICKTWEESHPNQNVHEAVNNEILKEKDSSYCKMLKCDGDKD